MWTFRSRRQGFGTMSMNGNMDIFQGLQLLLQYRMAA